MTFMAYVIGLLREYIRQGCPCLFRSVTGLYCPGCGGTRALKYLLRGDIGRSLWYHPLVGYMAVVMLLEFLGWIWRRGDKRREKNKLIKAAGFLENYEMEVYVGIGIGAVNWVIKNWVLLEWGVELIP